MRSTLPVSIIVPTYNREQILLDTINYLLKLNPRSAEIIVIDQTVQHEPETEKRLQDFENCGDIRWIKLISPSIPQAMNVGLLQASHELVLFVDDDIRPCDNLILAHIDAYSDKEIGVVAGQVIQPWDIDALHSSNNEISRFSSNKRQWINEFIGCNFSLKRSIALNIGGFDENFIRVAYRYEREFSERIISAGYKILFEPAASIHHLHVGKGGTRSYGNHLKTIKPSHAVGEYYFLMRSKYTRLKIFKLMWHPLRAIRTRHHLCNPWWIPATLTAEILGILWAFGLWLRGPRHMHGSKKSGL